MLCYVMLPLTITGDIALDRVFYAVHVILLRLSHECCSLIVLELKSISDVIGSFIIQFCISECESTSGSWKLCF